MSSIANGGEIRTAFCILPLRLCHRLVAKEDIPVLKGPRPGPFHGQPFAYAVEHRPPLTQNDRIYNHLVFIDQSML